MLNQLLLPHDTVYETVTTADEGWHQIRTMKVLVTSFSFKRIFNRLRNEQVRGAPAIAIVAALSLAAELYHIKEDISGGKQGRFKEVTELVGFVQERWEHLKTSRPTAVNLFDAATKFVALVEGEATKGDSVTVVSVIEVFLHHAESMMKQDVEDNRNIGKVGPNCISCLLSRQHSCHCLLS